MSTRFANEVVQAVAYFYEHWEKRKAPPDSALSRARRLLKEADQQVEPPSEETQRQLDELHGYLTWGRIMLSAAFLDPRLLALERRYGRDVQRGLMQWSDVPS